MSTCGRHAHQTSLKLSHCSTCKMDWQGKNRNHGGTGYHSTCTTRLNAICNPVADHSHLARTLCKMAPAEQDKDVDMVPGYLVANLSDDSPNFATLPTGFPTLDIEMDLWSDIFAAADEEPSPEAAAAEVHGSVHGAAPPMDDIALRDIALAAAQAAVAAVLPASAQPLAPQQLQCFGLGAAQPSQQQPFAVRQRPSAKGGRLSASKQRTLAVKQPQFKVRQRALGRSQLRQAHRW